MLRLILSLLVAISLAGNVSAADLGEKCKLGVNVDAQFLCPFGNLCLQSIGNRYCSAADKQCGWKDTNGYYLGSKKTYDGEEYVCTPTGFKKSSTDSSGGNGSTLPPTPQASVGDECKVGSNIGAQFLCPTGSLCLQAIDKKYCSHADRQCGWPGETGYLVGQTKPYQGSQYVCTPVGFQKLPSGDQPSAVIAVPGVTNLPVTPMARTLNTFERNLLVSVYGYSINYAMVRITNTEGASDGAPWTTNTPPLYTVNVGVNCYVSFERDDCRDGDGLGLLVHELAHVWQGQHGVPFMSNSLYHQGRAVIEGGDRNRAYSFEPGAQWRSYNAEQQAEIVEAWYRGKRQKDHHLYPYIRDNILPGKPNATTRLTATKREPAPNRARRPGRPR